MNRLQAEADLLQFSVPRASGDEPAGVRASIYFDACSPRQRG